MGEEEGECGRRHGRGVYIRRMTGSGRMLYCTWYCRVLATVLYIPFTLTVIRRRAKTVCVILSLGWYELFYVGLAGPALNSYSGPKKKRKRLHPTLRVGEYEIDGSRHADPAKCGTATF